MNHTQRLLLVASTCLAAAVFADEPKKTEAPKRMPSVSAQFGPEALSDGYRPLYIYSKDELALVEYKFEGVVDSYAPMAVGKPPEGFGYMTTSYLPTNEGRKFLVRGTRKDGSRFTNLLTVGKGDTAPVIETVGFLDETKEAVAAEAKAKPVVVAAAPGAAPAVAAGVNLSATEKDMIDAANAFRARAGKGPLTVSPELMSAARSYAASGSYDHGTARNYATRSGYQGRVTENLARGSMTGAGVIAFWGEPGVGHERQLAGQINVNRQWVDGGFTHVGVAGVNGNWVIYFGSGR